MSTVNPPRSRRPYLWLAVIVAFGIGLFVIRATLVPAPAAPPARGGPGGGGPPLQVSGLLLKNERVERIIRSSGTVLAGEEVELRSETAGRITGIHFKEGRPIKRGDLLFKIHDAELRAQLERVEPRLHLAEERESRQKILLEREAVSREEYDLAVQEKRSLTAERNLLKAQLDKTEIRAPFDGVVGLRSVSVGSYVSPGTQLAGFYSLNPLKIDFSIPEVYFSRVRVGDTVAAQIQGLEGKVSAVIEALEPRLDRETRMLRIRGLLPNPGGRIPPGASAGIELPLSGAVESIMVPSTAVLPDISGQTVFMYRGGKAVPVSVIAGYRTDEKVEIEGVNPGDTLILSGLIQMRPGASVTLGELQ